MESGVEFLANCPSVIAKCLVDCGLRASERGCSNRFYFPPPDPSNQLGCILPDTSPLLRDTARTSQIGQSSGFPLFSIVERISQ
jgi:hypothetical protein